MTQPPDSDLFRKVARIVSEIAALPAGTPLAPETRLIGGGLGLDSVAMLHLVETLERTFAFAFRDEDLTSEALASVGLLAELVARRSADGDVR